MPDREKVIEGLEKVWDAFNHMEHELYADYVFDALVLLKEQGAETIECKMCGHQLHRDWVWCPWCRWEIARQEGRCYGDE